MKLRSDNGDSIFSSVIIVTDRNVLDGQLQDAVKQIDHQFGVIAAIDRQKSSKSKRVNLADALLAGNAHHRRDHPDLPLCDGSHRDGQDAQGKNFAVIIDEAHNSQTGTGAKLQTALAMSRQGKMAR